METVEAEDIVKGTKSLSSHVYIKVAAYRGFYYINNNTNCKLCTIESLSVIFNNSPAEKDLELFKSILNKSGKQMFFIHVTNISTVNNISKHYKLIYCQEVPIGYGTGNQYHCGFLINPNNPNYGKRIDKYIKEKETFKPIVEEVNVYDSIEQFISKASNEEIDKLRSYKQPKRKKDLIEKIKLKV